MPQKILLVVLIMISLWIFDSQNAHAQRKKRGLLTTPTTPTTPTTEQQPAQQQPAGTSTPTNVSPGAATTNSPTGGSTGPMDLFEMATQGSQSKEAAAKSGTGSGSTSKDNKSTGKDGEKTIPPPEILTLQSDGISIVAALFRSPNSDDPELAKVIAPVMLLHDWGGSMNDLGPLAQYLQSVGHTVIVPDLRGHGRSVTMTNSPTPLDHTKFNRAQIATVKNDFEECKKRLIDFNNEGKLNISMLSVLAVGDMCPLATQWTLKDWSYRNVGSIKQGQDVQSLILVSPPKRFQQSSMAKLVRHPLLAGGGGVEIPTLVIYGRDGEAAKESTALYRLMERKRPASNAAETELRWAQQSLFELPVPGSADGAELLKPNPALFRFIGMFNFYKVSRNADEFPWASRESASK